MSRRDHIVLTHPFTVSLNDLSTWDQYGVPATAAGALFKREGWMSLEHLTCLPQLQVLLLDCLSIFVCTPDTQCSTYRTHPCTLTHSCTCDRIRLVRVRAGIALTHLLECCDHICCFASRANQCLSPRLISAHTTWIYPMQRAGACIPTNHCSTCCRRALRTCT